MEKLISDFDSEERKRANSSYKIIVQSVCNIQKDAFKVFDRVTPAVLLMMNLITMIQIVNSYLQGRHTKTEYPLRPNPSSDVNRWHCSRSQSQKLIKHREKSDPVHHHVVCRYTAHMNWLLIQKNLYHITILFQPRYIRNPVLFGNSTRSERLNKRARNNIKILADHPNEPLKCWSTVLYPI